MTSQFAAFNSLHEKEPELSDIDTTDRLPCAILFPLETASVDFTEPTLTTLESNPLTLNLNKKHFIKISLADELTLDQDPKPDTIKRDRLFSLASGDSHITSEDLIQNENIDFLYELDRNQPSSSVSPSFNYTKSDKSSSVFDTFNSPHLLANSFAHSDTFSLQPHDRSFDTQDPGFNVERMNLDEARWDWDQCKEQSRLEKEKIINELKGFVEIGRSMEVEKSSVLFEIGENRVKEESGTDMNRCGCSKCNIL